MLVSYLLMACIFSGICVLAMLTFGIGTALHTVLAPLSLWLIFEAIKNLNTTTASGLRSRTVIASASAIDYGCRIGLLWAIYYWSTVSPGAILYVLAAAGVAVSTMILGAQRALLTGFSWSDVRDTLLESIKFSWPMVFWGIFGWLQNMSNRWLLSNFSDLSTVAEYGVLVAISTFPVAALLGLVGTYIQPIIYERESAHAGSSRQIVRRAALGLIPVCGVPVLMAAIWHREIMVLLAGANYIEHSYFLPFIMLSASASAICSVLTYSIFAQRRVASLLLANTLPGALSLVVGYFAVRNYQFEGAVFTLILSQILAGVFFIVTFARAGHQAR
jgi:O-antigen/teichoic acid export membrane protein